MWAIDGQKTTMLDEIDEDANNAALEVRTLPQPSFLALFPRFVEQRPARPHAAREAKLRLPRKKES